MFTSREDDAAEAQRLEQLSRGREPTQQLRLPSSSLSLCCRFSSLGIALAASFFLFIIGVWTRTSQHSMARPQQQVHLLHHTQSAKATRAKLEVGLRERRAYDVRQRRVPHPGLPGKQQVERPQQQVVGLSERRSYDVRQGRVPHPEFEFVSHPGLQHRGQLFMREHTQSVEATRAALQLRLQQRRDDERE